MGFPKFQGAPSQQHASFAVCYAEQTFLDEERIGKGYALICVSPPTGHQLCRWKLDLLANFNLLIKSHGAASSLVKELVRSHKTICVLEWHACKLAMCLNLLCQDFAGGSSRHPAWHPKGDSATTSHKAGIP